MLRAFVAVAEELHFGRAARRLHLSQPPLSMRIRRLEEALGVRLFERDRRHVALTEAGAFFLDRARHLLAEGERSRLELTRIARGEAGLLAIGYTPTATYEVLPTLLRAFARQWPAGRPAGRPAVRLELIEMRSGLQADALRSGRIEVGLACGPIDEPAIDERVLARETFVAALQRRHALAAHQRLHLRHLDGQPFIVVRPDIEPAWADACSRALVRAKVRVEIAQETDSKIAMLGLVAAGVGVSLVSASMMRLARDGVVFRPIADLTLRVPLVGLTHARSSRRAHAFLQTPVSGPPAHARVLHR
jgi:DNA-binding transcriptional LysR family regulator